MKIVLEGVEREVFLTVEQQSLTSHRATFKFCFTLRFQQFFLFSPRPADAYDFAQPDILSATGIMAFAFMCHHNTFLIYQSMRDSSLEKWEKVTHISVG
jgi:amino acid permease